MTCGYARLKKEPCSLSVAESLHLAIEIGFTLESDAGQLRHRNVAVLHLHAIREAPGIHEHFGIRRSIAIPFGQKPKEWLLGDLRDRIPDGHVDGADRDRTFAMAARLL